MKKNITYLVLAFSILVSVSSLRADSTDAVSFIESDFTHAVKVGLGIVAAPLHWDGVDWGKAGLTVGGTAILFLLDKSSRSLALKNQSELNDAIFNIDEYHGNHYSMLLAIGVYGYGAVSGESKIRRMGLHAAEAFVYSGAITGALKVLFGRRRPYAGDSQLFFAPFRPTENTYLSLPSGHTTVSFAVSTALAKSLDKMYWKAFWYGSAGLVGAARIYHNKHWLSDVFLGAVIGYMVGDYVVNFENESTLNIFGSSIQPNFGTDNIGVQISF
jgi:membrane-associated phospholipid phosphatase